MKDWIQELMFLNEKQNFFNSMVLYVLVINVLILITLIFFAANRYGLI